LSESKYNKELAVKIIEKTMDWIMTMKYKHNNYCGERKEEIKLFSNIMQPSYMVDTLNKTIHNIDYNVNRTVKY